MYVCIYIYIVGDTDTYLEGILATRVLKFQDWIDMSKNANLPENLQAKFIALESLTFSSEGKKTVLEIQTVTG